MRELLTEDQRLAALHVALTDARRCNISPDGVSLNDWTWNDNPVVNVTKTLSTADIEIGTAEGRLQALATIKMYAKLLKRSVAKVDKDSGEYQYRLTGRKTLAVIGAGHPDFEVELRYSVVMDVDAVCERVPVLDADGSPVLETVEEQEVVEYRTKVVERPKFEKRCPKSLIALQ